MTFVKNINEVSSCPLYRALEFSISEAVLSCNGENGLAAIEEFQITS